MIPVTKPFLPPRDKLNKYIDGIYERQWLTNDGPLVRELTQRLENFLNVKNLLLVSNGTLALQVALAALNVSYKKMKNSERTAITTPFTFAATTSALCWEGISPVYCDINEKDWCINESKVEALIDENTVAIVPVHVFGSACNCEELENIASRNGLPLIFDAAHAFDVQYNGRSLLSYGDASTLSFHATKLFHSIEGGAIVFKSKSELETAKKIINFGLDSESSIEHIGLNAKMNEFQAAMALCNLDEFKLIKQERKHVWEYYQSELSLYFSVQATLATNNYSYFPVLFDSESQLLNVISLLSDHGFSTRRYFSPSLNKVKIYAERHYPCPVSEDVASRILCLPLFTGLKDTDLEEIVDTIKSIVGIEK